MAHCHTLKLQRIQWKCLRCCLGFIRSTNTAFISVFAGDLQLDLRFKALNIKLLTKALTTPIPLVQLCNVISNLLDIITPNMFTEFVSNIMDGPLFIKIENEV